MIIAMSESGRRTAPQFPTESEQRHVDVVLGELARKLQNPEEIEESDIFIAYLLAVWSDDMDSAASETHVNGVMAIMSHLAQKLNDGFSSSPLAPFWAFLRDEILWRTRKSENFYAICQDFRDILGPKTIEQRQTYESELRSSMTPRFNSKVFYGRCMYSSVHTLMEAARIVNQRYPIQNGRLDPLIESVLVELHMEQQLVEQKDHESQIDLELEPLQRGEYVRDWHVEVTLVERFHDLIGLYVCRLATVALEAPSVQEGLSSPEGLAACANLIAISHRATGFLQAGIQGERVFGTGTIGSSISRG
jgi:hypothetical protein